MTEPDPNIIHRAKQDLQHDCPTPHQRTAGKGYFSASLVDYGPGTRWRCPDCNTVWVLRQFSYKQDNLVSWNIQPPSLAGWLKRKSKRG